MSIQQPHIFVVGNLNMDLILEQSDAHQTARKKIGESYRLVPGGNGSNAAVAAARAGANVSMLGKVGADAFGSELLLSLRQEKISCQWVTGQPEAGTGLSLIVVAHNADNSYVDVRGANALVSSLDIDAAKEDIQRSNMLVVGLGVPQRSAIRAMRLAREANVPVLFEAYQSASLKPEVFQYMDYLFLDSAEAEVLSGYEAMNWKSARIAAAQLLENGVRKGVIIHLKGRGLLLFSDEGFDTIEADPEMKIVDASAMDDCFTGVLAFCLASEKSPHLLTAASFAYEAALYAGARFGAQATIPSAEEMRAMLRNA